MKKMTALVLAVLMVMAMAGCGAQEKQIGSQLEAVIVDTDPENRIITVEDAGEDRIFRGKTRVDCEEAPVYHEGDTASEISFLDLEPGDRIRLELGDKARKDLGKGRTEIEALRVEILK